MSLHLGIFDTWKKFFFYCLKLRKRVRRTLGHNYDDWCFRWRLLFFFFIYFLYFNILSFCRCAFDILKRRDKKKKRLCPDCHKSVSSRLYLHCEDSHDLNQSSLSLASLRASSLVTLEDCHATSSVWKIVRAKKRKKNLYNI